MWITCGLLWFFSSCLDSYFILYISYLQEMAKTPLPSLLDPLILALSILFLFSLLALFTIPLAHIQYHFNTCTLNNACFLFIKKKWSSNTNILYSFSIYLFSFYLLYKKNHCYMYCFRLTELVIALTYYCFFVGFDCFSFVSCFG